MDTMTTTAIELVAPVVLEGTVTEDGPTAPTSEAPNMGNPDSTEAQIGALKDVWSRADNDEREALSAVGVARVWKARTAYMAGKLGSKTGTPNNKAAMRILDLAQNTVRPYFLAGEALAKAGWVESILPPTAEEIELITGIVTRAQKGKSAPKAPKADSPAGAGDTDTEADTEGGSGTRSTKGAEGDAVTMADVIDTAEAFVDTLKRFCREQGFPAIVADNLSDVLAEAGALIESHRVDGGDV